MKLAQLTREQCQIVRQWRNEEPQFLRTPYLLTEEMQDEFYDNVVSNRDSRHRYFGLIKQGYIPIAVEMAREHGVRIPDDETYDAFIGIGGLTNIEWENGCTEISLILAPVDRDKGYGREAVKLLLDYAFNTMRLVTVYGEVYHCGNYKFWEHMVDEIGGYKTHLIGRKMYDGTLHGSTWFAFKRGKR